MRLVLVFSIFIYVVIFTVVSMGFTQTGLVVPTHEYEIQWEAPTENADGTQLTDLAGYRLYKVESEGLYVKIGDDISSGQSSKSITVDSSNTVNCYVVTAFNTGGFESAHSNEVCDRKPAAVTVRIKVVPKQ